MSLDMFIACAQGYSDRLVDQQQLAVYTGFWAGYYGSNNRRKKPLQTVIEMFSKVRKQGTKKKERATEVNVEEFLRREKAFKEKRGR